MITHKRGDSFDHFSKIPEKVTNPDGTTTGFDDGYFVGWTVAAQVRTAQFGKLLADLVCTWDDPVKTRILSVSAINTRDWVLGPAEMDIQFVRESDGRTLSTSTIAITVTKDITRVEAV